MVLMIQRMILPLGMPGAQQFLTQVDRSALPEKFMDGEEEFVTQVISTVRFVPLVTEAQRQQSREGRKRRRRRNTVVSLT